MSVNKNGAIRRQESRFYPDVLAGYLREVGGEGMNPWAVFVFPEDSPVFSGHFPGNPILPAVIQMALVRLVAERCLNCSLRPKIQERSRFTGMVGPGDLLRVELSLTEEEGSWRVAFSLIREAEGVARGEIVYVREQ